MFEISTSTVLFDDMPQKDFLNDDLNEYKSQISQEWRIVPVIQETTETMEEEINEPQKISIEAPKSYTPILKGSTGSKVFSMLQNMAPSTRTVVSRPEGKSADVKLPNRKLRFS